MVDDRTTKREIVIRRRNNNLQFIADIHRSFDSLQYPLMFWKGQDGYCINAKRINAEEYIHLRDAIVNNADAAL